MTPPADVPCRISLRMLGILTRVGGSVRNRSSSPAMETTTSLRAPALRPGWAKSRRGMTRTAGAKRSNPDFTVAAVHNHLLAFRRILGWLAIVLVFALYFADLTGMGMYSADEPRYADVGRAMAHTGDWVTPRLWGRPWF